MSDDETSVFADAKPVAPTDLVETETAAETKTETKPETTKSQAKTSTPKPTGAPVWHLSLALGLVIALAGGTLLWLQSPVLAIIVIGAIVVAIGLGLALWHLFGRETGRDGSQNRSRGATGASGDGGASRDRSRRSQQSETGPETRRSQSRQRETGDRGRARRPETTDRSRSRSRETGSNANEGNRPRRPADRSPNGQPAPGQQPNRPRSTRNTGPREMGSTTSGPRVPPREQRNAPTGNRNQQNALGGSSGSIPPRPPKNTRDVTQVCGPGNQSAPPTPPKPSKIKDAPDVAPPDKPTQQSASSENVEVPPVTTKGATTSTKDVVWPSFDYDHHAPLRTTHVRRAVKLPPVYHRNGRPSWPADDLDTQAVIPSQRGRGNTMATPDQLTPQQRSQHWSAAAATATREADKKNDQAYQFISQAAALEDVSGMETDREAFLNAAGRAAHDAQVRQHLAGIFGFLSEN